MKKRKKFISDVLNLYKEKVVNELNSCSNYEPGNIKNCPICGKQSLSASNSYCRDHTNSDDTDKYHVDYNDVISNTPNKDYFDKKVEEALKENTMDNYIVINGKKLELTEEQLKQLGIEDKKRNNPFERRLGNNYYVVAEAGGIGCDLDESFDCDNDFYENVNYFNDKTFANLIYLHELLNRKLLKYAWDNNAEDREWDCENLHYHIIFSNRIDKFFVGYDDSNKYSNIVYFSKKGVAEQAIEDVVKPFIKEHTEFVW